MGGEPKKLNKREFKASKKFTQSQDTEKYEPGAIEVREEFWR